ncbi:MAG: 30S ribosomal protein S6 [Ignavibacteria bacterium]|nr:30S ribosomal protein S6 [Ignavibacteria bacterium]
MSVKRLYETTIIVNAALEDNDVETVVRRVTEYLENHGASIVEIGRWGRKRLNYPIKKKFNGYYVYLAFEIPTNMLPIIERFFILEENILRHLTVLLPQKLRDYRAARTVHASMQEGPKDAIKEAAVVATSAAVLTDIDDDIEIDDIDVDDIDVDDIEIDAADEIEAE